MAAPTTTLTLRLPEALKTRMEQLAQATARSQSFLAVEAIEAYVADNEWQIEAIREGLADADAGRLVEHAEVATELAAWGKRGDPAPRPPVRAAAKRAGKREAKRAPSGVRTRARAR